MERHGRSCYFSYGNRIMTTKIKKKILIFQYVFIFIYHLCKYHYVNISHNNQPRAKILARGWGAWWIFRWLSGAPRPPLRCGALRLSGRPWRGRVPGCAANLPHTPAALCVLDLDGVRVAAAAVDDAAGDDDLVALFELHHLPADLQRVVKQHVGALVHLAHNGRDAP